MKMGGHLWKPGETSAAQENSTDLGAARRGLKRNVALKALLSQSRDVFFACTYICTGGVQHEAIITWHHQRPRLSLSSKVGRQVEREASSSSSSPFSRVEARRLTGSRHTKRRSPE